MLLMEVSPNMLTALIGLTSVNTFTIPRRKVIYSGKSDKITKNKTYHTY